MRFSYKLLIHLGLLYFSLASQSLAQAESVNSDELFKKVFKKKREQMVLLPLFFQGSFKSEVQFRVENSSRLVSVNRESFLKITEGLIDSKLVDSLKVENKKLLISRLRSAGIMLTYDAKNLAVVMTLAPEASALEVRDISFSQVPDWAKGAVYSKGVSGFINLFNYYRSDSLAAVDSITSDQNLNLNFGKLSFFAQTTFQRDAQSDFFRQDVRFNYDDTKNLIRYQLGDLNYRVNQFQAFQAGAGFLASTNFDLDPYRLFNPLSFKEITLNTPSRVRVFINNVLVQTLNLPTGRHRLDNLPLNEGINDVRIEIQDNRGRREEINFKGTTSYSLIADGVSDFTYGLGVPALEQFSERRYDSEDQKYFLIMNHLYGLGDRTNIGFGFMGDNWQKLASLRYLHQSLLGLTDLNLSGSLLQKPNVGEKGRGLGVRLTHLFRDYSGGDRLLRNIDFGLEYLGPGFTSMGLLSASGSASLAPELGVTQFLSDKLNARLRVSYRSFSKTPEQNIISGSGGLTAIINRVFQVGAQYTYSKVKSGLSDHQVLLNFNFSAPEGGQVYSASYNTSTKDLNAGVNYNGEGRPSNWRAQADIRTSEERKQYEAEVGKEDQRYVASYNHQERRPNNGQRSRLQTANLNTSLVFAGGAFSVTRPVNQGFALVSTGEAMSEESLYLNRNGEQFEAETGFLNGAVLPNFQAYRFYPIRIDSRDLGQGLKAPPEKVVVAAPYGGGVRLHFSSPKTYALVGKIFFKGKPLDLKVGVLKGLNDGSEFPLFTNRKGRFLVQGVPVGRYELRIEGKVLDEILVSESSKGIIKWEGRYE